MGIVTWYSNHADDRQKAELVKYISIIRKDPEFMNTFYAFHDDQRKNYDLCPRDSEGYYGGVDPAVPPQILWTNASNILKELNEEGLNQLAVDVLRRAGFTARVNEVGHIAVAP
jgi:hypothetical protein